MMKQQTIFYNVLMSLNSFISIFFVNNISVACDLYKINSQEFIFKIYDLWKSLRVTCSRGFAPPLGRPDYDSADPFTKNAESFL